MSVIKLSGTIACSSNRGEECHGKVVKKAFVLRTSTWVLLHRRFVGSSERKELFRVRNAIQQPAFAPDLVDLAREEVDCDIADKVFDSKTDFLINGASREGEIAFTGPPSIQLQTPNVLKELIHLSVPAIVGQAIEPLSQLIGTAYVGRLGVLELAAAGVSLSIFNIISKVFNIPLLNVATSFVAEDISNYASKDSTSDGRRIMPAVSTALAISLALGLLEAAAMTLGSGFFLKIMGVAESSPIHALACHFLRLRAIGAPAVVVSLAIHGIFRGFKDTRTPVLCLGIGNLAAVFFFPITMYIFRWGISGAAISTVASQYIVTFLLLWHLNKKTVLVLPSPTNLNLSSYLKSGGFIMGRTVAVATTVALSTSMVARLGAISLAAHQICLQVWLSASLLVEAQASAGQALIANSLAKGDKRRVQEITYSVLKTGLFSGISLAVVLSMFFPALSKLFTTDAQVLDVIRSLVLFVGASQPLSALAYIFDGLHYGVSDFAYSGCSTMLDGVMSCAFIVYASSTFGLFGVWSGLSLFMGLRTLTGLLRLSSRDGPWWFLHDINKAEAQIGMN